MGVLMIAPEHCTNCHSCELACSLFHEEEFNPDSCPSRGENLGRKTSLRRSCACSARKRAAWPYAPRARSRKTRRPAHVWSIDRSASSAECVSRFARSDGNFFDTRGHKILKCDLCGGDPQCATVCPSGAIVHGERSTVNVAKRLQSAAKLKAIASGARR